MCVYTHTLIMHTMRPMLAPTNTSSALFSFFFFYFFNFARHPALCPIASHREAYPAQGSATGTQQQRILSLGPRSPGMWWPARHMVRQKKSIRLLTRRRAEGRGDRVRGHRPPLVLCVRACTRASRACTPACAPCIRGYIRTVVRTHSCTHTQTHTRVM